MKKRILALALALAMVAQGGVLTKSFSMQTKAASSEGLAAAHNSDAIQLSKTISAAPDENGAYTITLESYTTGAVTMGQAGNPLDLVLVLDQSSSMMNDFDGNLTLNQEDMVQHALKQAVAHFVDTVHENAEECGLNHRIAIVSFDSIAQTTAEFTDVEQNKGYKKIKAAIDGLTYDLEGATLTHSAMERAEEKFDLDPYQGTEKRDKVVVVFSDGQPNDTVYADEALETAYRLKNEDEVKIYTIGTFAGADPSVITGAATANVGEKWLATNKTEDPTVANRFMNYLSSNSNDAKELGIIFVEKKDEIYCKITAEYRWKNKGYYFTANNAKELDQMFDNVSQSVTVDAPSLNETGQLKDFLSPYFVFPEGFSSEAITVQTAACIGVDAAGAYQWAAPTAISAESGITAAYQPETKSIRVTGFDYAGNVVTKTSKSDTVADFGQKLIVSFSVKAKDGFLGGNEVVSNTDRAGIYTEKEEPIKYFDLPYTDVVLASVPITTTDHSIYLGNAVNSGDAVALVGNPFDGVNNAYVDTELAVYWDENANGTLEENERANFEIIQIPAGYAASELFFSKSLAPQENAQYLVEETLTPIYGGSQPARKEVVDEFSIYPLVPSVTVQDVWVDYGVPVALSQHCVKEVQWAYLPDVPADAPAPHNEAPAVRLSALLEAVDGIYTATKEQTFTVQALQWESTDGAQTPMSRSLDAGAQSSFTVHLNLCNLTLTKTVEAKALNFYLQPCFFTAVQGDNAFAIGMTAQALADGVCSKKLLGLYAGQSIDVAEDSAWAWRYATEDLPATVLHQNLEQDGVTPLISTEPMPVGELTLAVHNTLTSSYWLSTEQTVVNRFDGKGDLA